MKGGTRKLYIAAIGLLASIAMLAGATYAWYTISTNPEIKGIHLQLGTSGTLKSSLDEDEGFNEYTEITELFENYMPLRPVSTFDGITWFIPAYDSMGALVLEDFYPYTIKDEEFKYHNVYAYQVDENGNLIYEDEELIPYEEKEYLNISEDAYFLYGDFYLLNTDDVDVNVVLSTPLKKVEDEVWYGSYVVTYYDDEHGSNYNDDKLGTFSYYNTAVTSIRLGFMTWDDDEDEDSKTNFMIYEPNADLRSDKEKPEDEDGYVIDFTKGKDDLPVGVLQTSPVSKIDNDNVIIDEINYKDLFDEYQSRVIRQLASNWKNKPSSYASISNNINIGSFVDAIDKPIVRIKAGEVKKVRLFIWVEGQDIDCWNDIAGGGLWINLEFAPIQIGK